MPVARIILVTVLCMASSVLSGDGRDQRSDPRSSQTRGPLTPDQALASFELEPGYRIELAAAEPLIRDPVAMAFDQRGRMYVAESRGYPGPLEGAPGLAPEGVIALLEDTDHDGRFDKRTDFARNLTFPNGILPWDGGVFVTCAPDLLYLKDTTGDGIADERRVVLTGFDATKTAQLRVSHPTLGIDNWIYLTSGLTGGRVTASSGLILSSQRNAAAVSPRVSALCFLKPASVLNWSFCRGSFNCPRLALRAGRQFLF